MWSIVCIELWQIARHEFDVGFPDFVILIIEELIGDVESSCQVNMLLQTDFDCDSANNGRPFLQGIWSEHLLDECEQLLLIQTCCIALGVTYPCIHPQRRNPKLLQKVQGQP